MFGCVMDSGFLNQYDSTRLRWFALSNGGSTGCSPRTKASVRPRARPNGSHLKFIEFNFTDSSVTASGVTIAKEDIQTHYQKACGITASIVHGMI